MAGRKRLLAGSGVAQLAAARGCAHADDPGGCCPACAAYAAKRAAEAAAEPIDNPQE